MGLPPLAAGAVQASEADVIGEDCMVTLVNEADAGALALVAIARLALAIVAEPVPIVFFADTRSQ